MMCPANPCPRNKFPTLWRGSQQKERNFPDSLIPMLIAGGARYGDTIPKHNSAHNDTGPKYNFAAQRPGEIRNSPERPDRHRPHNPHHSLSFFRGHARAQERLPFLDSPRLDNAIPRRGDAAGNLSESRCDSDRRSNGGHILLGASRLRRAISGIRDQLRAPRLSGALVCAIGSLYVPVSWRRLLRRRLARGRSAGTRPVYIPLQSGKRPGSDPGGCASHTRFSQRSQPRKEESVRLIEQIGKWLDRRLQLGEPIREIAEHSVPRRSASWWYVFGSAALTVFALQIVTGIMLALIYVPSASEAWNSLQFLNHDVALGWFIRALHGWGSNFMVAIVLMHMVQVFLFGAYKFPRELTWLIGVFLLLMTLGMAFSGQVLRFDQDAYWGLGIGASIASRVPIVGPLIVQLMLGGPIIGGATLSRFFAIHVFVIPAILLAFVSLHLL